MSGRRVRMVVTHPTTIKDDHQEEFAVPYLIFMQKRYDVCLRESWQDFSVRYRNLMTDLNPISSRSTAEKVVEAIEE